MNVRDLIEELQMHPPHMPVKVLLSAVMGGFNDKGDFRDDMEIPLSPDDAIEADRVRNVGGHVLILSK